MLALPVMHPQQPEHTLLRVGYELEKEVFPRLQAVGVRRLWVQYPGLEYLHRLISPKLVESQVQILNDISQVFTDIQRQATAKLNYRNYCQSIAGLIESLIENPQAAMFLDDLAGRDFSGMDLMRHASSVTYLSVILGLKLEGYLVKQRKHIDPQRAKEVTNLGVGAMLHDIGITQLSPEIRQQYLKTEDENAPGWSEHPTLGFRLVREHIEPSAATIVLNHHQRVDGSGYAGGAIPILSDQRIHVFARIVGLVEQFDRLRRMHTARPRPTVAALRDLLEPPWAKKFDQHILSALLTVVPPYPPGSIIRLTDGRSAIVVDHHPHDPCRPVIQFIDNPQRINTGQPLTGVPVDLAEMPRHISVATCDGEAVAEYNFPPPPFMRDYRFIVALG